MSRDVAEFFTFENGVSSPIRGKPVMLNVPVAETLLGELHPAKFEQATKLIIRRFRGQIIAHSDARNSGRGYEIAKLPIFSGPMSHDRAKLRGRPAPG